MPIPVSAECRKTGNAGDVIMGNYNTNQKSVVILKDGLHYRSSNWKNSCFKGQHSKIINICVSDIVYEMKVLV
jgi:hypothetical protein